MRRTIIATVAAGATAAFLTPASAQLATHRDLTYAIAKTIAETALETCQAKGFHVSVHVVDRDGNTVISMVGDGAAPHTYENSRRKAYTAMTFRRPSTQIADALAMHAVTTEQQMTLPNMIGLGGGLPIMAGNDVLGGVGISGSPMGNDEPCAKAGIDKVAAQLR
jgi:uncharacterized protein GlcG (DUF336 family)